MKSGAACLVACMQIDLHACSKFMHACTHDSMHAQFRREEIMKKKVLDCTKADLSVSGALAETGVK